MRVLWICNIVLNDFAGEFGIKRKPFGGWMEGMFHQLRHRREIEIGFCFPIHDEFRMKNGIHCECNYYSFHSTMDEKPYDASMSNEFLPILRDFQPDVIQIWGTEYNHARAIVDACSAIGIGDNVLIHVQGLVSYYAMHYALGVPEKHVYATDDGGASISDDVDDFIKKGKNEEKTLKSAKHITGRTDWDKICSYQINPSAEYHFCNENLRKNFYESYKWDIGKCQRHSIFLSQASYPVKGAHYFLQAVPILCEKYQDLTVYIGGSDPTRPNKRGEISPYGIYLRELIEELEANDKIHFLGALDESEIIAQYLNANVFVSPSTIENSSNSISEAMILGTPVVASYVGGTPSMIKHGRNGLLYPCDAYYMMAGYISRIFEDDELALRMSRGAIETATKRHDREKNADRLIEIYGEIARGQM